MPQVFISYSHDSRAHMDGMLALSNRLRSEGVDCRIDQYEEAPPEGWPNWCANQVDEAEFVLVVCTETYERRFRGKEEGGKGLGVTWEGHVITQELYDAQAKNSKFIPLIFSPDESKHIPIMLRSATLYDLSAPHGYQSLYRRLTRQPEITRPELGQMRAMPARSAPTPLPVREGKQEPTEITPVPGEGEEGVLGPGLSAKRYYRPADVWADSTLSMEEKSELMLELRRSPESRNIRRIDSQLGGAE